MKRNVLVVGLAGGIASGKSLAARMLGELGARVLDADEINHAVLLDPDIVREVVANWGTDVLDERGALDRKKLAEKVFGDSREVRKLEGILHPEVLRRILAAIAEEERGDRRVVVIDAPLLFEAGLDRECDRVIFIDSPEETRVARAMRDRKWDGKELARRERHQKPSSYKREHADDVLKNLGSPGDLRGQVEKLWHDRILPESNPKPDATGSHK